KKELEKNAKEEFKAFPVLEDQFELVDGEAVLKSGTTITEEMIGAFKLKAVSVNKKIHGVYDKIGAAKIEREWWGGLVMQYHKHLYPGIMKRYRRKGYYNEARGTVEVGSYVSLVKFLSTEFRDIKDKVKKSTEGGNDVV